MHIPMHIRSFCGAAALLCAASGSAHAVAGSDSLAGWSVAGDAIAGNGALTLTTAFLAEGDADTPFNLSGHAAVDIGSIEAAAGVPAYALDLAEPDFATEGSVLSQHFEAQAGQRLSFDWSFTSADDLFQDHAFAVVNGQVFTLATRDTAAAGLHSFSLMLAEGPVWLAIGIVDTGDVVGVSSLGVSGLQLSPVPEPGPAALLLAGIGLLAWRRRGTAGRSAQ